MGACASKVEFDELKYPSYCPQEPPLHDDHLKCLEIWVYAVRTRPEVGGVAAEKAFTTISRTFYETLESQHIADQLPRDFLIHLVSTLINGRHVSRAASFRHYDLSPETWSAVGTALLITVRSAYAPRYWTDEHKLAWLRCYGALLREVFRRGKLNGATVMTPGALYVPGSSLAYAYSAANITSPSAK